METTNQSQNVLADALMYCNHLPGRLLPIPAGQKGTTLKAWPTAASKDPEQVTAWFEHLKSNLGFVPDRGYFVLDLDRKNGKDGFKSIAELEAQFGTLPTTLTATTPNGGHHRYFTGPDLPYKTCADAAGLAGVDFRCAPRHDGGGAGYVVLPPSQTPEGAYAWKNWPDISQPPHIAESPRWLVELAAGSDPRKRLADAHDKDHDEDEDHDSERIKHLASALEHLDADAYDSWIAIGLALKTLDDDAAGLKLWLNWSAKSPKFDDKEAREKWRGFEPKDTHYRTVFTLAQSLGWRNPGRPKAGKRKEAAEIAEFNKTHAVVIAGGSVCILREGYSEEGYSTVEFMKKTELATYYQNQFINVERVTADGEIQTKRNPLFNTWLSHPERRTHEGVTFAPAGAVPAGYYNLWRGYAVEPLPLGVAASALACKRFLHHLKMNICRGNKSHFRYLLAWIADMVQDPMRKKGVALVLRGKKGTGKSTLADALSGLLGKHSFKCSKSKHIVGDFNKTLVDKLLLLAEESFFAGSHADIGTLKDLITSNTVTIEPKHVNPFEIRSCHRICMLTNSEWAVPATEDERRFFVLDVGEDHIQDWDYFAAIDRELRGGGLRALLTLLQKLDISKVNLRKVPQTAALAAQKVLSLEQHDQFILDCLTGAELCGAFWDKKTEKGTGRVVGALWTREGDELVGGPLRSDVYNAYVAYARASSVRPIAANRFGTLFTNRTGATPYQPGAGDRRRRYELPEPEKALARMQDQLGIRGEPQ